MWVLLLILATVLAWYFSKKPSNFPPGPPCVPILGSVPFIKMGRIHFYMEEARAKYGPVVGLKLGMANTLFVCAPQQVLEVLKMDVFQGRPPKIAITSNKAVRGIILTDGPFWLAQRRFTLRHLRDFGFGKTSIEGAILEEIDGFFRNYLFDAPIIQAANLFNTSAINVLWRIISGTRFQHNDQDFKELLEAINKTFREGAFPGALKYLRKYFRSALGCPEKIDCEEFLINFLEKTIEDHKRTKTNEPRDFIDVYLREIENSEDPDFNELTLISICLDLFTAGADTTGSTLSYCVMYLVLYPDIQRELSAQIDQLLEGKDPSLSDRFELPKLEAFLSEVSRISAIAPIAVPRRTQADVNFNGYSIPKNTTVLVSIWSVLRDKDHWGDPDVFRPSRFLGQDGRYVKDEWLVHFGIGKRQCLGESLAKNVIFLFIIKLLQEFEIGLPEGADPPDTLGQPGFTSAPQPFVVTLKRKTT